MLPRSIQPLAARAANFATAFGRPNPFLVPFAVRTVSHEAADAAVDTVADAGAADKSSPRPGLRYFVGRNSLNNLGVYHRNKSGGNYKITMLKYAEGDLAALKKDLTFALGLKESEVNINRLTGHIMIKGHKREEVVNYLNIQGF
ncbi:putative ribosomal protein L49 IMG2 [Rosellinia necatrix]|uniref:Large ribosomal subunit protein mL49 n=1 Tax=Rosellinia necatrix TaxID=77044 RepID=A0A1W2TQG6_ROSNE|nr:putative ribosomal protein L49 IMG2 [Rosellinia necatrix]